MTRKRDRANFDTAVADICSREVGCLSTRKFAYRRAASKDLVLRFELLKKLSIHQGFLNTISFNPGGDILVSGSEDQKVILWDWETGNVKLSFHSGHGYNIYQAKIMPGTDDRSIVTCASDGQVRHAIIPECGVVETKLLGKHQGRAHKLAIEPGSPHIFYTCGEDGLVQHFDLRTGMATGMSCRRDKKDLRLYSIAIDPRNPNLFVVAGSDEFARLYDIRRYKWDGSTALGEPADYFCPKHLIGKKKFPITGLAFSDQSELAVSYCDDSIYLFSKGTGLGGDVSAIFDIDSTSSNSKMEIDNESGIKVYKGRRNCKTITRVNFFGPKCEYVVSGSECWRVFIWRKSDSELIRVIEAAKVNCIEPHPRITMLAGSGFEGDIKIWTPSAVQKATLPDMVFDHIEDDDDEYDDEEEEEELDDVNSDFLNDSIEEDDDEYNGEDYSELSDSTSNEEFGNCT